LYIDTDACTLALSCKSFENIDDCVKHDMRERWGVVKKLFFGTGNAGDSIIPGMFKIEATGQLFICFSSKCYSLDDKISLKGCNKIGVTQKNFIETYNSESEKYYGINRMLKRKPEGGMHEVHQKKLYLSTFFIKRFYAASDEIDNSTTYPLHSIYCDEGRVNNFYREDTNPPPPSSGSS